MGEKTLAKKREFINISQELIIRLEYLPVDKYVWIDFFDKSGLKSVKVDYYQFHLIIEELRNCKLNAILKEEINK